MRFLHLRVFFLSLLSFCILMYFVMVAKHIFHLSLVFASISFQSFQQCVFFGGVAGCMNFFFLSLFFVFVSVFIQLTSLCNRFVLSFLFHRQHAELCGFCKASFGFCRFSFKTHVNLICHRPRPISSIDPLARESRDSSPNIVLRGLGQARFGPQSGLGQAQVGTGRARVGPGRARVGPGRARVGPGRAWVGTGRAWVGLGRACFRLGQVIWGRVGH